MPSADIIIIGGGIVGLATAYRLSQSMPQRRVLVLEKEDHVAGHQTGHNSGVLHTGIYYKPGSLKAINCREGKLAMQAFCQEQGIAHEICGKVIVAVNANEIPALERIYQRGIENGIQCSIIDAARLRELEPHAAGVKAIHVPQAGIVNYRLVCEKLSELVCKRNGEVLTRHQVLRIQHRSRESAVLTNQREFTARLVVNCAGLHSDRITKMGGDRPAAKIVPFRGEYYQLKPSRYHLCRNLIYPVPDPKFPFLGVHFTRMIDGSVECGPNAVLAFAREGYTKYKINPVDLVESLTYRGFIRMAWRHWRMGVGEIWRSVSKAAFVRALQRLMPEITASDLLPAPAGVRAQAVSPDGTLVDDFLIVESEQMIHVNNAPSPAATASLNIGARIAERIETRLGPG
jgi:(S)-2-hydroxyglutarate dehydrogenase